MEKHKYAWERILGEKMKPDTQLHLPPLFEACINYLEERALDREGVFRVPGSARQVAVLKEAFKTAKPGETVNISDEEPFTICSLLSDYLRNEEPLLTYELADEWVNVAAVSDWILRLAKIAVLIEELPLVNHAQLYLLLNLLVKVGKNADVTRMGNNNLGTIFGPMICRRKNSSPATELRDVPRVSSLCIELLNRFEELFPTEDTDTVLGKHQKRGGRNMGAAQKKLDIPEVSEVDASGEGEIDTSKPGKPLKSLSQMGNFYVKPKSPRNGEDHKVVSKSPMKEGSVPIKLDFEGMTDFKKMDEEEIRRRSRTLGSISIKSGAASVSGGTARRPSKVNEEDVLVMRMRSKSSRNNREDEKKSSSAESADLFSEEELDKDAFRFGGKLIPITKPKRRSTSWPEVEVADFKRKMQQTIIEELLDGSGDALPPDSSGNEKSPEKEEEIRKQFEMKKKLLELKKKELESRKAEIIKRLESSGNVITTLEEKEKEEVVNEEGGSKLRKRKGSEGGNEGGSEEAVETKLRRWKLRHQKIQEELKNIKMHSSPKKSRSQRTKSVSAKSDEEGGDEIEQKKYNSHDGSQKSRKRSDYSDGSSSESEEESNHVMYVIEKFYGKSKSARETRRTKSKNDLREKSPSPVSDEAFPGIRCHTELNPPSEIKRRYSEEMKRSREMVAKKWEKENKNKEHPSEISGWQLEQLKKLRQEQEIDRLKKKLAKKEKEAEREREREKEKEKEKEKEGEEKSAEKEEGETTTTTTTTTTTEPGSPREKKKKRKGSARRKLIKKIEDEEKKLRELNLHLQQEAAMDQDQMKHLASEGMCATGAEI